MSNSVQQPVKVGVVGVGGFGRLHAITFRGIAEAELVALVDANDTTSRTVSQEVGGVPVWKDLDAAASQSGADAWVVATRTESHVAIAERLMRLGKSVLIEKPMAASTEAGERLSALVQPDSRNLMVGHILLFTAEFRRLLNEVHSRGPLRYLNAVRHRPISQGEAFVEETPLRLLMVHDLYVALALMSGQEPVSFQARHGYSKPGRADLSVAQVEWPGGVVGSLTASFLTPAGMPADGFDRLEVFGEGWAARMNLNPRPLEVWSERAEWPLQLDILADPAAPSGWLAEELRHFCRVVRGVEPVRMGARYEDGLRVQRWLEQLEHSASKRETNHA